MSGVDPADLDPGHPQRAAAPALALIASVARNGVIGSDNALVWHEPEDQRWFRRQTMGCPVVMGRKTWDSLPARFRPLPGRDNIVVTRQLDWAAPGALVVHKLGDALALGRQAAERTHAARVFVIGGGQLFVEALPLADELLLTEIDADLPGETRFPDWRHAAFHEVRREPHQTAGPPACGYAFVTYQRQR